MKKIKRIVALVCAMVMMMAMSTVAFADNASAAVTGKTITVNGLAANDSGKVSIYKLADVTNQGKWAWNTSWVHVEGETETTTENQNIALPATGSTEYQYDLSKMKTAAEATTAEQSANWNSSKTSVTFTNCTGAAYLVLVSGSTQEYNPMVAKLYTYNETSKAYEATDATVVAKNTVMKATKKISKTTQVDGRTVETLVESDDVKVGETVNFKITTTVPYISDDEKTNPTFKVFEKPDGIEMNDEIKVTMAGATVTGITSLGVVSDGVYTIDLSSLLKETDGTFNNNANAGKTVVISLSGIVSGAEGFTNQAWTSKSGTSTPDTTVNGYTGGIVINKYTADSKGEDGKPKDDAVNLDGATFNIVQNNTNLKFKAVYKDDESLDYYILSTDTDAIEAVSAANGTVTVKGLEEGTYTVKEASSPTGYQLANDVTVTVASNKTAYASYDANVFDSPLASLPMTGGMGTTLFTVIGVAIMVLAAALYLANKKKNAAN